MKLAVVLMLIGTAFALMAHWPMICVIASGVCWTSALLLMFRPQLATKITGALHDHSTS